MAVNNNTILAKAFLKGTNDFQQHVSPETISKLAAIEKRLTDPMNGNLINDFMDTLVTRIGFSIIRSKRWDNMLRAVFHGQGDVPGELRYGSTIQEIVPKWIKGHAYDDDVESLLKMHRPDAVVLYHFLRHKTVQHADVYLALLHLWCVEWGREREEGNKGDTCSHGIAQPALSDLYELAAFLFLLFV